MADCPYQCDECKLRFPSEAKLLNHIKNKRKYCLRLKCPESDCIAAFANQKKLNEHRCKTHVDQRVPVNDFNDDNPDNEQLIVIGDSEMLQQLNEDQCEIGNQNDLPKDEDIEDISDVIVNSANQDSNDDVFDVAISTMYLDKLGI